MNTLSRGPVNDRVALSVKRCKWPDTLGHGLAQVRPILTEKLMDVSPPSSEPSQHPSVKELETAHEQVRQAHSRASALYRHGRVRHTGQAEAVRAARAIVLNAARVRHTATGSTTRHNHQRYPNPPGSTNPQALKPKLTNRGLQA